MTQQKQGQGNGTVRKEAGFAAVLRMSLRVSKARPVAAFPYWHLDLNSGSGWNAKAGCLGSPAVFLDEAARAGRAGPVHVRFCDTDSAAIETLRANCFGLCSRVGPEASVAARAMDNADFLRETAEEIRAAERNPGFAVGSCLCDPNGFPDGFPVEALKDFACDFPRIDLAINLNVSLFARVRGCKDSVHENIRKGFVHWPELGELIGLYPRRHWWVRNPPAGPWGMERFVTFYGHNWPRTKRTAFAEFVPLDSLAGQEIVGTFKRQASDQKLFSFMLGTP
jgi:hypothetical protein